MYSFILILSPNLKTKTIKKKKKEMLQTKDNLSNHFLCELAWRKDYVNDNNYSNLYTAK